MKQQKRIIQHLIQRSKTPQQTFPLQYPQKILSNIQIETIQTTDNQQIYNQSLQLQPTFTLQVSVDIGDGRCQIVIINQKSDPYKEAQIFCQKYHLENYISKLLGDSLAEQKQKQKQYIKKKLLIKKNNNKNYQQIKNRSKQIEKSGQKTRVIRSTKAPHSPQKSSKPQQKNRPKINQISEQIIKKIGKNKIIESSTKKFQKKIQQHIIQKLQKQQYKFYHYSFHPTINYISRKVDETINKQKNNIIRYQQLYQQHKQIQNRKQLKRKNSTMQIPFKPIINQLSRNIISKKRSLGSLFNTTTSQYIHQIIKQQNQHHLSQQKISKNQKKSKPNSKLSQSTQQLCYHLYQQAKIRKQKIQKQSQRLYKNISNNWKIKQNSNQLITSIRQNKIRQIFYHLTNPPHSILHHHNINFNQLTDGEKIFIPIFQQMIDVDTQLNQEQFVQAGIRLLKYLTPHQKSILTRRNSKIQQSKQNISCPINKRSQQILKQKGYNEKDIYIRGLLYKKQLQNTIQKKQQQKIKKQLQPCTFKPKIHDIPGYHGY